MQLVRLSAASSLPKAATFYRDCVSADADHVTALRAAGGSLWSESDPVRGST